MPRVSILISWPLNRTGQFRVAFDDGLVVERLPIGLANGLWRVGFVCTGRHFLSGNPPYGTVLAEDFRGRVRISSKTAPLLIHGGSSSGGDYEFEHHMTFTQNNATDMIITYQHQGSTVVSEVIDLA